MLIDIVFKFALGFCIIAFAGKAYRNPEVAAQNWFPHLSRRRWGPRFLRGLSVLWIFCGLVVMISSITPLVSPARGVQSMLAVSLIAAIGTLLFLHGQK